MKYPQLEFLRKENIHTVNTANRKPGIVNVILHLNGEFNIERIKTAAFNGVFRQKNKLGELLFPKLSSILVPCWGHYAWKTNSQ